MVINWYGEASFRIQSGDFVLLSDPFDASSGLAPPRFKASLILRTEAGRPIPYERDETPTILGAGEYEVQGNQVTGIGIPGGDDKKILTAYAVNLEDIRLGFLGYASEPPTPEALEMLGGCDILFVPAGGAPFLSPEAAAKIVKQVNPKIAVASLFRVPGLKRKAGDVKEFLDEFGQKPAPEEKLVVKKKDLPQGTQVKVLTL